MDKAKHSSPGHREPPIHVREFLKKHLPTAKAIQRKFGIPAGVVIAQSALETGWGRKVVGNAYFGVKGHSSSGASSTFETHEVINGRSVLVMDRFRAYSSYDDAANDYGRTLSASPRYRSCFLYSRSVQFATALGQSGYATDPTYAVKLISIIRAYHLDQYDSDGGS
jgi:peptidoglycan hydrolase FlgJ